MPSAGRVVVLNGTSSAGKTTLATAFRDARAAVGDYWLLIGIDDVLSKLPAEWVDVGLPSGIGPFAADGMWFEQGPAGVRVGIGPVCRQLFELYHRAAALAARSGLNVIIDEVVIDAATLADWHEVLDGLDPTWVGVRCAREIVEQREGARGDRPIGMAAAQYDAVHCDIRYALEIDTGVIRPDEALLTLSSALGLG